jgi:hypothetical protein
MAYETEVYYGFKASNNLSDVIDSRLALKRINLEIGDLDIIRGAASDSGAVREDLIAISGLNREIYRTTDRFLGDSEQYKNVLDKSAGADTSLRGNLNVNGPIGGSAIRYKFLDNSTDQIKFADISTSRVSAWSTTTNPAVDSDPIFYGAQVKINSDAGGNGGTVNVDKLTWGEIAQPKLFDAEIPTHKITTNINGQEVKLYAMKSIPLKLQGYFRGFNGNVRFNSINDLRVSWRIINLTNSNDEQRYANIGTSSSSTLNYRSVSGAPRLIEIYYPPDNITSLTLTQVGLSDLPAASLSNLNQLNVALNEIKQMPNLNLFAPNLQTLNIFRNNLYLAENENFRKLNAAVVARMPPSITSLNMYGTFFGSIRWVNSSGVEVPPETSNAASVLEYRFPSLVTLNVQRGSGPYFSPDQYDPNNYLPTVPNTCENYYAGSNDFRSVPSFGLKSRTNLKNFSVGGNRRLRDDSFSLASLQLETVALNSTDLPIPDLKNRPSLRSFSYRYGGILELSPNLKSLYQDDNQESSYKFNGCAGLNSMNFYASRASGFLPKFKGNRSLSFVDFYAAQGITGGRQNNGEHGYANGQEYVMYKDTFADSPNVSFFRVLSYSLLRGKGFEDGTFSNLRNLYYLYWYSYYRTGAGGNVSLPDTSGMPNLRYFIMPVNSFSGSAPSFVSNNIIFYVQLAYNNLTGPVPSFPNKLRMHYLYLYNNQLSSFSGFANTPNMRHVYLQNNVISGKVPLLSNDAPNIDRLYLFNNNFNGYEAGSLSGLLRLRIFDISRNNLSTADLNNIIDDLFQNYNAAPRGGVSINLRSQSRAPGYSPSPTGTQREQEVREKITFLQNRGWNINIGG